LSFDLSLDEGRNLVHLARKTIENKLDEKPLPDLSESPESVKRNAGVFVTLTSGRDKGDLRGCIGLPYPHKPLVEATVEAAEGAAFRDPRFSPIRREEMDEIIVEVSVLTPPELVEVEQPSQLPPNIIIGKDGLIIQKGGRSGLLLPQVAVDWDWNSEEFLCQCCKKAWLPMDAWLSPGTKVMKFNSIIFKEESPRGDIKRLEHKG
jgi:hypothetical protein